MSEYPYGDFIKTLEPNEFFDYSGMQNRPELSEAVKHESRLVSTQKMNTSDYLVAFSTHSQNYCVGIVDMVNSTKISAQIGPSRISQYYQIFLNSMGKILGRFGGFVIKNIGDCLVYYFPESNKTSSKYGFMSCLECSLAMVDARDMISEHLIKEKLPTIDYRISADFGSVVTMKSTDSDSLDMIGAPVNMCSKINRLAAPNGIVIGGDLYEMTKTFDDYSYKKLKGYSIGLKFDYPVFSLSRK